MRIRFLMLGMVIAALACACRDAHAQCQDWADGFGQNEMGTDFLVYSLLATVEDGQEVLYVGGNFNRIGGIQASRIARWDGSQWSALGAGVDGSVQAMAVYDDGSGPALYVGGSFQNAGGQPAQGLARWKDGQWSSVGGNVVRNTVQAITVHDSRLIIGGTFSQIDGQPTQRLAAWDGVGWEAFSSGPSARTGHALAYDAARAVTVLFGGKEPGGGIEQQDTWTFDGQAWKRVALDGPERRLGHAMTYDSLRGRILMMGGQPRGWGGATDLRLWGWDGASWTVLTGAMPITRRDIRIAYDSARDRVVWFGGQDGSGTLFDSTWEYDGTSWFEVFPSTRPPARSKYALAYDEGRQRIVMYGGLAPEGCCHGDTWEWDGTDWTLVATTGPGQRNSHAMAYDAQNGHIVMYGGFVDAGQATDTWAWDGVTWTLLAPTDPSRPSDTYGPMAYDEVIDRIVMRDGLATTWLWDGWAWSFLNIGGLNNEVFALASFDSGAGPELYAGGAFTRAGAVAASRIARLGPSGWEPLGEGLQHDCMALRVWNDGGGDALYVGGKFNTADGNKAAGIARWDGSAWSLLNVGDPADGGGVSGVVWAISPGDDGTGEKLYVAGSFDFADGPGSGNQGDIEALNVARWDGSAWEALGGGIHAEGHQTLVRAVAPAVFDGEPRIVAGGDLKGAGGKPSRGIAVWGVPCSPPIIIEHPENLIAVAFEPAVFSVRAQGTRPFTYQWRKDGVDIADSERVFGTTTDLLTIDPWIESDGGLYDVVITNDHGSETSDYALLTTDPGGGSGGIVSITPVLMAGDPVPWSPGEVFTDVCCPSTAPDGSVVMLAWIGSEPALVAWTASDGLRSVARQGEVPPGVDSGAVFASNLPPFDEWAAADTGGAFFKGVLQGGDATADNRDGLWHSDEEGGALVARSGFQAGGLPEGALYHSSNVFERFTTGGNDWIAFPARIDGGGFSWQSDAGWWRWSKSGGTELILRQRTPSPGIGPDIVRLLTDARIESSGAAYIIGEIDSSTGYKTNTTNDYVLWYGEPGALTPLVMSGDPAPGFDSGVNIEGISGFLMLGAPGEAYFEAGVAGPMDFKSKGLFRWDGASLSDVVRRDQQAPGLPAGSTFWNLAPVAANQTGTHLFYGSHITDCANCPTWGLWRWRNGIQGWLVANRQDPAPGAPPGFTLAGVGLAVINDEEEVIISVALKYDTIYPSIYGWSAQNGLFPIVVAGSQLEVMPGDVRVANGAHLAKALGGTDSHYGGGWLTEDGRFAMQISFTGGSRGVFVGHYADFFWGFFPCIADFNGDGLVNTLDVLAFLNAWTAQDDSADINNDGLINTLDVLAFLNAWVAGCSD